MCVPTSGSRLSVRLRRDVLEHRLTTLRITPVVKVAARVQSAR
jgi:hypothetical protein